MVTYLYFLENMSNFLEFWPKSQNSVGDQIFFRVCWYEVEIILTHKSMWTQITRTHSHCGV